MMHYMSIEFEVKELSITQKLSQTTGVISQATIYADKDWWLSKKGIKLVSKVNSEFQKKFVWMDVYIDFQWKSLTEVTWLTIFFLWHAAISCNFFFYSLYHTHTHIVLH